MKGTVFVLGKRADEIELEDGTITKGQTEEKVERPPLYKVLLHNDDYTPMFFVVFVLQEVFQYSRTNAEALMLKVDIQGSGLVGVYPYEIAEMKLQKATQIAHEQGFPLLFTLEEDSSA